MASGSPITAYSKELVLLVVFFIVAISLGLFFDISVYTVGGILALIIILIYFVTGKALFKHLKSDSANQKKDHIYVQKVAPLILFIIGAIAVFNGIGTSRSTLIWGVILIVLGLLMYLTKGRRIKSIKSKEYNSKTVRHNRVVSIMFIILLIIISLAHYILGLSYMNTLIWGGGVLLLIIIYSFMFRPK